MFGLGWMTYTTFRLFVRRDFSFKNLFLLCLSFYLIAAIKIYILLAFMPALAIWLLVTYTHRIHNSGLRLLTRVAFVAIASATFVIISQGFAEELNRYSLDSIAETAVTTGNYINYVSGDEGSAYSLGEFDPSIGGMLLKFPQAVVVTFYRPFPWEARKLIVLLSALESLTFVFFTVQAFRKRGVGKAFSMIFKDPNLFFLATFSLIFAFAVGISSYNFGALSRYKIPCLPFYAALLVVVLYQGKESLFLERRLLVKRSTQPAM